MPQIVAYVITRPAINELTGSPLPVRSGAVLSVFSLSPQLIRSGEIGSEGELLLLKMDHCPDLGYFLIDVDTLNQFYEVEWI
jgi:hypothetical protein